MPPIDCIVESFIKTYDELINTKAPTIYSIGYEGRTLEEFIQTLKKYNIQTVIDVRELPLSRKKGFSKTRLSNTLNDNGIKYIHMKNLGVPKELRKEFKSKKITYKEFSIQYKEHLYKQVDYLRELFEYALSKSCVLMCYERDWKVCHRRILTEYMEKAGFKVDHIFERKAFSSCKSCFLFIIILVLRFLLLL